MNGKDGQAGFVKGECVKSCSVDLCGGDYGIAAIKTDVVMPSLGAVYIGPEKLGTAYGPVLGVVNCICVTDLAGSCVGPIFRSCVYVPCTRRRAPGAK